MFVLPEAKHISHWTCESQVHLYIPQVRTGQHYTCVINLDLSIDVCRECVVQQQLTRLSSEETQSAMFGQCDVINWSTSSCQHGQFDRHSVTFANIYRVYPVLLAHSLQWLQQGWQVWLQSGSDWTPNWTNPGLYQIRFQYIWLDDFIYI